CQMISLSPQQLLSQTSRSTTPLRFSANPSIETFRKDVKTAGEKNEDVVLKTVNQDAPETQMSQGLQKLKLGGLVLAGLGALLGTSYVGYQSNRSYQASKPSAATVAFDKAVGPDWHELQGIAEAANKTGGATDATLEGKFYSQLNAYMQRVVTTMQESPGELDQTLVTKMLRNSDFMPAKNAFPIATDYVNFMEKELQKQGTTPAKAAGFQIDRVDVLGGFIGQVKEFENLSVTQKQDLSKELKATYKEKQTTPLAAYFAKTIRGTLGSGIEGVTLQKFQTIKTKDDAKKLFETVVDNSNNYKELTPTQRQAFKERGKEILDSLDHYSPSPLWGISTAILIGMGLLGAGALTLMKGNKIIEALGAPKNIAKGLNHPTLIINYADRSNPEAERQLSLMTQTIHYQANEMARLMKESYQSNDDIRKLLVATYPTAESLPDAAFFTAKFIYEAKKALVGNRSFKEKLAETPVDELAFTQKVMNLMEDAYEKGNFAPIELPQGMLTEEKPDSSKAKTPVEFLQIERRRMDYDLRKAMGFLANRNFGYFKDTDALAKQQKTLDELLEKFTQDEGKLSESERKTRRNALLDQQNLVKQLEEKQKLSLTTLNAAKLSIGRSLNQLQQYQAKLTATIGKSIEIENREQLVELQKASQQTLEDPALKKILEEAELKTYIDQAKQDRIKEEEEINRKVEEALNGVSSAKTSNSSTKSVNASGSAS
ncbi:MAG: hypothetical protein K2X66_11265, partial [Cyanobacteria bacterium]|nr:hypothetical protein [Cyanobacteriota bacterium]